MTDHGPSQLTSSGVIDGTARRATASGSQQRLRDLLEREDQRLRDLEKRARTRNSPLARLYNLNRRIFMTPCREEEWTLSVTHTERAIDEYVAAFEELTRDLTA